MFSFDLNQLDHGYGSGDIGVYRLSHDSGFQGCLFYSIALYLVRIHYLSTHSYMVILLECTYCSIKYLFNN
jgi:hypothetical protein